MIVKILVTVAALSDLFPLSSLFSEMRMNVVFHPVGFSLIKALGVAAPKTIELT